MPTGVTRILPFAAISAILHGAVLINVADGVEIAVTPDGNTGPVSVRLVPSGPAAPESATQSGVAASVPEPSREGNEPSTSTPKADRADTTVVAESPGPAKHGTSEPASIRMASADRLMTEAPPTDTARKQAETAMTEKNTQPDEPETTPDTTEKSTEATATSKTEPSASPDIPDAPGSSRVSKADEILAPAKTDDASTTAAAAEAAETSDRKREVDKSKATDDGSQDRKRSGAAGTDDRAQLASRARQQVEIHFRDRFRYPRIARQRGWEGRVVLTFRLQSDGRITDVEVTESSGRSILDENARETLIHIQRVPEIADRLQGDALKLEVPVTYRLQPA